MEMAEDHSPRPQVALPAKLRWRPYSNGSTKSSKRQRKDDSGSSDGSQPSQSQALGLPQAKALAHRVREKSFRSAKAHRSPPVSVQLQWEENETMESMSHGGHPHNQHPSLYHQQQQQQQPPSQQQLNQYPQQQGRLRNISDSSSETDSDSYSTSRRWTSGSSLSSTTPSKSTSTSSKSPITPVQTQPGELDLSQYKAKLPGLTGDDFLEHGLPLPSIEANTVYQVALNELLENHRKNMLAEKAPALAITSATNPTSNFADSASQQRRLSNSDLMGISTIEELLASCGYSEPPGNYPNDTSTALQIPASPASTIPSLQSSPLGGMVDLQQDVNMSHESRTPLDISSASFDQLMAQTPVLLSEGDSKHILLQQQQRANGIPDYLQTGINWSATSSPFSNAALTHDDPLINGSDWSLSSAWPSLFPKVPIATQLISRENTTSLENAPRIDIAIQTDPTPPTATKSGSSPISPPLSGVSVESSPNTHLGLNQEELNPDWLTFLEENSPLFPAAIESFAEEPLNSSSSNFTTDNIPPSPSSATSPGRKAEPVTPPGQDKGAWNWAADFLKQGAMAPTGHRTFPTAGSFGSFNSRGGNNSGGMVRTLRGSTGGLGSHNSGGRYQQRSGYHTQASSRNGTSVANGHSNSIHQRDINAMSADELSVQDGVKKSSQVPRESTLQKNDAGAENKATSSTSESPRKKLSAEKESSQNQTKVGTDTAKTTTNEGFGGLLAMLRSLWKGNGGDKSGP
ncbi:hypothetical protein FBU30_000538 [Linnemannia zychae]|nr:hypothetical protein FBU30_000538 [Linnemannia zychae]